MGQAVQFNSSGLVEDARDVVNPFFRHCLSLLESTGKKESHFAVMV